MGNRIKLTEPGAAYIGRVTHVALNKSGNWPDYEFTVENGDVVQVPQKAADRQLERLKLDADGTVGSLIKFSRSDEPGANGKLFWNVDLAAPAEAKPSRRVPPPSGAPPQGVSRGSLPFDDDPGPQDPDEPLYREPAPTPRETREKGTGVSERETAYLACFDRVVAHVTRIAKAHGLPVDASACQAITFSIMGNAGR